MAAEQMEQYAKWKTLIEEQEKSGLTQKVFCEKQGLNLSQFIYYKVRLKRKKLIQEISTPHSFTPIKIQKENHHSSEIKIIMPNGFQCIFPSALDILQVKRWLEAILSC